MVEHSEDAMDEEGRRHLTGLLVAYVLSHPHQSLSEMELATQVRFSVPHIRRVFAAIMGEPLASFIRRTRLERAAGQLANEDTTVKGVAADAQFQSSTSFTKAFRNHFGTPPSEFRELNQDAAAELPGYLAAQGRPIPDGQREIGISAGVGYLTTFLYEGKKIVGKQFPDGRVEDYRAG